MTRSWSERGWRAPRRRCCWPVPAPACWWSTGRRSRATRSRPTRCSCPGAARLARWGLLDRLVDAGTPAARRVRFEQPGAVLEGSYRTYEGVDAVYSPRRTLLDTMLVDAARAAGAEVRQNVTVTDLVVEEGTVCGVRLRGADGRDHVERAPLVVGADGRRPASRSTAARSTAGRAARSGRGRRTTASS